VDTTIRNGILSILRSRMLMMMLLFLAPVTILLVEDEPGHAMLIEKNVRRAGIVMVIVMSLPASACESKPKMHREDIPKAFEIFRRVGKQDMPGDGMGWRT
jgi:hypothetical protein